MPERTGCSHAVTQLVDGHIERGGTMCALHPPVRRTVVICPHPDDEALGTGGLIARQLGRGVSVVLVAVTDGEAAFSATPDAELAVTRRAEQAEALHRLGQNAARTVRLGLPDGAVADREGDLAEVLTQLLVPGDLVVAPWSADWHPDHEACGRAADLAAAAHGCVLWGSLFWGHHHLSHVPAGVALGALALTEDERRRRLHAVRAHSSQFDRATPVVRQDQMSHLELPTEYYLVDPLLRARR